MKEEAAVGAGRSEVRRLAEMSNLYTPWSLRTAVTLGLPDLIAEGPEGVVGIEELGKRSGTDTDALRRLTRHLANLGLFEEVGPDGLRLTDLGEVLRSSHPAKMAHFLDQGDAFIRSNDAVIPAMVDSIRTGGAAWESVFEKNLWESLAADEALSTSFDRTMSQHADILGRRLAETREWAAVDSVVDVGGGSGQLLANILREHAHVKGTVVDLPDTVGRAAEIFEAAGVSDRADVVGRSFFEPLPAGADAYLLVHVLHNWPTGEASKILRGCAEAAGTTGKVLVVDQVVDLEGHPAPFISTQRDLCMLVMVGGQERTAAEFEALGEEAGLRLVSVTSLGADGNSLLEFQSRAQ
ncbi:methyltransferase [Streptomyces sp. NPDC056431]|uniref:methyltransferase n=1 Tax=Streptomyces sp. NPDC056431 TaxID=3345814 RepID=UPI0036BE2933